MTRLRTAGFAALAGALIAFAGAPRELSFPAFLAPAAFLAALEPRNRRPVSAQGALGLGLMTGFVANLLSMYWVVGLLMRFGGFPWVAALPAGALLWIGQSASWSAAALWSVELMRRRAPGWLVVPACLTVAHSLAPALFPWRYGLSQLPFTPYAQVAELGGLPLMDWLVATVGCAALDGVRHRSRAPLVVATLCLFVPVVYGTVRLSQVRAARESAPSIAVGVVQPHVSMADKHDPRQFLSQLRRLRAETRLLEARNAELVLWPESAYRYPIHRNMRHDRPGPLRVTGGGVRGPLLVGALTTDGAETTEVARDEAGDVVATFTLGRGRRFNSAVGISRNGEIVGIADKVRLLAFGEYTPLWDRIAWLQRFPRGLTPGTGEQVVEIAGVRVGVLNCYEDLLDDHVRRQARHAPDFWANLTNDTWFGNTSAPHLHHMSARMRAIETRRDLVRAVNSGVSGHTAATGEDLHRSGSFVPARFIVDVRLLGGTTPWVRFGDWVTPLLAGALLGFVLVERRRGRAARAS